MFERILEKILLAKVGKYIVGLDKEQLKVAVWQGDIILENVHLKSELFQMWQLPLVLDFNIISRLIIKIPWSKLASEPVEIILEGLLMIINPQQKENWDFSEPGNIAKRLEYLELHASRRLIQAEASTEEELQNKTFIEKLTSKVLDNIKVKIRDIHIRLEYHLEGHNFSAGITLQKIDCFTTNSYWEKEFASRTQNLGIFKLISIEALRIYWKCEDASLSQSEDVEKQLIEGIYQDDPDSILAPTQMRVVHNPEMANSSPKYSIELILPSISMKYEKAQFHDTVRLFEYFTDYNKFLLKIENKRKFKAFSPLERNPKTLWKFAFECIVKTIRQRKNRTINMFKLPKEIENFYKDNFKDLYKRNFLEKNLDSGQTELYHRIIYVSALEDLYSWVTEVQNELEIQKQQSESKPSKWKIWKYFTSDSQKPNTFQSSKENKSFVWMILKVSLISGSLQLSHLNKSEYDCEGLLFRYEKCYFESKLRLQGGSISLSVDNLLLSTFQEQQIINIFEKLRLEEEPLLLINLDISPIDDEVQYKFDLSTQPISVDYTIESVLLIWGFFNIPETQESVKTAAWDTLQNLQDTTAATLTEFLYGETKYSMHIKLSCPHIRIPSSEHGKFLLNLGVIDIRNSSSQGQYETLSILVSGIQLDYLNLASEDSIIPELRMNWQLSILKTSCKAQKYSSLTDAFDSFPDFLLDGELYELKVLCMPSLFSNLKGASKSFDFGRMNFRNNAGEIIRKGVMSSWVKKKTKNIHQWHTYFAVLSGGYIYFFISEDAKFPSSYYYIKDSSIEDVKFSAGDFGLRLRNRYGECFFGLSSELEHHFWKRSLNEQINEFETYKSVAEDTGEDRRMAHKESVSVSFEIRLFEVLFSDNNKKEVVTVHLEKLTTDLLISPFDKVAKMGVYMQNSVIFLYSRPGLSEGFTINISKIEITNKQFQDTSRTEAVLIDAYTMQIFSLEILNQKRPILTDFDMKVKFYKPCLSQKQQLDPDLDKSYTVKCKCERLLLTLTQEDFTLVLKLMSLNLSSDEQTDEYSSAKVQDFSYNPNHKFLYFNFKAKVLSLLLTFDQEELVEIFFANQEVKMWKYNNGSSVMNFVAQHWLGLIPEEAVNSENPEHAEIAEAIFSISMDNIRNFEDFEDDDVRLSYVLFGPICNNDPNRPTLQIDMNSLADGSKTVIIDITQLRLNLNLAALFQLQNFIYYGFPDYNKLGETPYDHTGKLRQSPGYINSKAKTRFFSPELELKLSIQEPIVLLPSIIHQRVLVVQSDFSYTFFREAESMYLIDQTPSTIKTFEAAHLEIYTCKLTELNKHSFTDIVKRKILEPVEVIFKSTQMRHSPLVSSFEVKYQMGAFLFTLSHKDMMLIHNIISFQQEILNRENDLISALLKSFTQREDFVSKMSPDERDFMLKLIRPERKNSLDLEATDEHDYSPGARSMTVQTEKNVSENSSSTTVCLSGITLLFIYDTSIAYAPVVDLNFSDFVYNIDEIGTAKMYKSSFVIKSNFYNPLLDIWEPFVESVGIHIELLSSPESNPQTKGLLIVEKSTILNINLSEVMLRHYLALLKGWRVKEDSSIMEVVSPISIKNFSGCKLLIEKHSNSSKEKLEIIELNDMESKNVEVESMQMKSINLSQEYLNVSFLNDLGYTSLKQVPINKVQSLSQEVMDDIEKIPVVLDIELNGTTKLFIVRSSVVIKNETSHDLKILFNRQGLYEERYCKSQDSIPVPIHFVKHNLAILPVSLKSNEWSLMPIQDLNTNNNVKEIKCQKFFLWVYTHIDPSNPKKSTFFIRPPLTFINSLSKSITLQLFFDSTQTKEIVLIPGGTFNEHLFSGKVGLSCVLQIDNFQKSKKKILISKKEKEKTQKSIKLQDSKKDTMRVQLYVSKTGCQIFTFFSSVTIINNTMMPLSFIYQKSHMSYTVGGQNYLDTVVHCSPTRKISMGIGKERSDWMHVETVGTEDVVQFEGEEIENKRIKYHFAYSVSLAKVLDSDLVFSKVVLVVPRFILINNMQEDVNIKQYHASKGDFLLEKASRIPFHWPDSLMPEMIRVRVTGQWNWSGPFSLSNIGAFTIQNRHKVMVNHFLLINVEVKLVERSFYVIFEQEEEKFCNYCIENYTKSTYLKVYQKGFKDETRYLDPDSLISFAWSRPQADHEIVVEFCKDSYDENLPISSIFSFNKINQNFTVALRDNLKVYAKVECEGPTKILKFSDNNLNFKRCEDDRIKSQFNINVEYFGVSVIEYTGDQPHELVYFFASNIVFFAQETAKQWAVELLVNSMQLDNQISVPAIYPVILSPNSAEQKTVLHIALIYNISLNPNIYCFEKCEFLLQELAIKLESKVLQKTVEMCTRLLYNSNAIIQVQDVYKLYEKPNWMVDEKIELNKLYYFAALSLSPIKISLSLIPIKEDETDVYGKVSKALGMAITTIDLAPVKLNTLQMTDVFGSQWQVWTALKSHYGKQLIAELISLIGHAEILGNPIGLLNNLGTGVKDFFYEPAQGIIHGPLSAGKGFIKGTGSLVRNTVEGTFDTFSKLANSMATGITTLTQDREYLKSRQREQMINRPRNIVDGVEMGVRSLMSNLGQGISGVVSEPVKGYRRNRFTGLLLGSFRGLSGLVVKPVAGVLDVASKAAEGIKNTAGLNQIFGKNDRKRPPRVFYGKNSIMKNFNIDEANAFYLLTEIKKGKYLKEKFVAFADGFDSKALQWVAYLFVGKFILVSAKKRKVKWEILTSEIEKCEVTSEGLCVNTQPSGFRKTMGETRFVLPVSDLRVNKFLAEKISGLLSEE